MPRATSSRPTARALGALVLVLLTLATAPTSPASAHATLVGSTPAAGAVLDEAPAEVVLIFDERVRAIEGSVRVFDRTGERVDAGESASSGLEVRAPLPAGLPDGAYLVSWQVVSDDGHPIRGSFGFSVGVAEVLDPDLAASLTDRAGQPLWDLAGWITRFLSYAGALLAAGLAVLYCRVPRDTERATRLLPWLRTGAWTSLVAIGANVLVQGVRLTGSGIDAFADPDAIELALRQGGGIAALVSAAGLIALTVAAGPLGRTWWLPGTRSALMLPAAALATVGFSLAGHTATSDPRWAVTALDAVHATAGAVWFGGLVGVALLLGGATSARRADVVARFSGLAALALGAVAVTGVIVGWRLAGSWSAVSAGGHGRVLLAKVGLVAVAAALGAWNRYRLVPNLTERGEERAGILRRIVLVESALLLGVIGLTASLVIMPPGDRSTAAAPTGVAAGPVSVTDDEGREVGVTLRVEPGSAGVNRVVVRLARDGEPADDVTEVRLRLAQDEVGVGPLRAAAERTDRGVWQSEEVELAVAGTWEIEVFAATGAGVVSATVLVEL